MFNVERLQSIQGEIQKVEMSMETTEQELKEYEKKLVEIQDDPKQCEIYMKLVDWRTTKLEQLWEEKRQLISIREKPMPQPQTTAGTLYYVS